MPRDQVLRATVRKLLKQKRWQRAGNREVAAAAGCGKFLVGSVRRELIAAGLHPVPEPGENVSARIADRMYKPGTSVRGGYVYGEHGEVLREIVWLERQKRKGRSR